MELPKSTAICLESPVLKDPQGWVRKSKVPSKTPSKLGHYPPQNSSQWCTDEALVSWVGDRRWGQQQWEGKDCVSVGCVIGLGSAGERQQTAITASQAQFLHVLPLAEGRYLVVGFF